MTHRNSHHSHGPKFDIRTVAAAALQSVEQVLAKWLPGGMRKGAEWVCLNPTRPDAKPGSFSVNLDTGRWADFASSAAKGGDLVALVAYLEGCRQGEAARLLGGFLGLSPIAKEAEPPAQQTGPHNPRSSSPQQTLEAIPADVLPTRPHACSWRGKPSARWTYRDATGTPLFFVYRFDPPKGRKQFAPLIWEKGCWRIKAKKSKKVKPESHPFYELDRVRTHPAAHFQTTEGEKSLAQAAEMLPAYEAITTLAWVSGWLWAAPPEPRPLYGLDRLAARLEAPVVVAEGEKAADAAAELLPTYAAVATMNGAQSPGKSDFSPLQGRRLYIWPDNDDPGRRYAEKVTALALAAEAASVSVLELGSLAQDSSNGTPRELPAGWDAADALAEGWTAAALEQTARWEPAPGRTESPQQPQDNNGADVPQGFERTKAGVFAVLPPGRGQDGGDGPRKLWLCRPLFVRAVTRDERNESWGRLLEWQDRDGNTHRWAAPLTLLSGSGEALRTELHRLGLEIATQPEARRRLLDFLLHSAPENRARSVTRTGWASGGVFVLPDRTIGEGAEPVIFQAETAEGPGFAEQGTLGEWRQGVAALAAGNSRVVFSICCAFAAPLLDLAGDESGGFHLRGSSVNGSSSGKTTTQKAAASVCGSPAFVQKWRGTDNGLEAAAEQHNDTLLLLDELAQQDPRSAGEAAYLLANGAGKARAARTGDARPVKRWRLLFLSSGEIGLAEHMAAAGKKARAGQEVRMAEIPADAGAGLGVFENLHGFPDGASFSRALTDAAAEHYGTAFPAFVAAVIRDRAELPAIIRRHRATFVEKALADLEPAGQVLRVAARFGLVAVAGELATSFGITGWDQGEALKAAETCFRGWLDARGGVGSAELTDLLGQVAQFFELHGEARFTPWDRADRGDSHMPRTSNRAGFVRELEGGGLQWYVLPETFQKEVLAGFDRRDAIPVLLRSGFLVPGPGDNDGARSTQKVRLPGFRHPQRVYLIDLDRNDEVES